VYLSSKTLGNDELGSIQQVLLYPNPTTDMLYLKTDQKIVSVEITDLNGSMLKRVATSKEINVEDLVRGNYRVIVTTAKGTKGYHQFTKY
jgi:hypothetical protein